MSTIVEQLKGLIDDERVRGLRFHRSSQYFIDFKKSKHDIEFLEDGIIFTEKKGGKNRVLIPLHSSFIEVLK